jgi:hypothetical protein
MPSEPRTVWQRWSLIFIGLVVTVILIILAYALGGPYGSFAAGFVGCLTVVPAVIAFVTTFWVLATRRAITEDHPQHIVAHVQQEVTAKK